MLQIWVSGSDSCKVKGLHGCLLNEGTANAEATACRCRLTLPPPSYCAQDCKRAVAEFHPACQDLPASRDIQELTG